MTKNLLYLFFSSIILSCSHVTHVSESIVDSVDRLYPRQYLSKTKNPNYFIHKKKPLKKRLIQKREVASVEFEKDIKTSLNSKELSNKQVYFKTLFGQYLSLQQTLGAKEKNYICPAFHHMVVTEFSDKIQSMNKTSKNFKNLNRNFSQPLADYNLLPAYPLLALDYDGKENYTTFAHLKKKKTNRLSVSEVNNILRQHLKTIKNEVYQMCDKGHSADFYLYENFVTVIKGNKSYFDSATYVKAHLKISIFSNMYLLDYLNDTNKLYVWRQHDSFINNLKTWEKEALRRTDGKGFVSYLYQVSSMRHNKPVYTVFND
ncbi:hypothetical protein N9N67_02355 [Bacteriovoracaceae bacterium]|nr:hypothetical protein [Bacteriovoracaceae bacterium]